MQPFFHIMGIQIPAYWAFGMVGLLAAALFVVWNNHRYRVPREDVLHLFLLAVAGAIMGSKLLYLLTILPLIVRKFSVLIQNPALFYELLQNGYVFYGGFLGAMAMILWYCRKYGISLSRVIALTAPAIPLFHVFGRIGCFFAGCCWGIEVPWGIAFSHSISAPNGVPLLPVQLMESALNLIIFFILLAAEKFLKRKWTLLLLYMILYGAVRFILEFFRGDTIRGIFLLSTSQWIALALILISIGLWVFSRKRLFSEIRSKFKPAGK